MSRRPSLVVALDRAQAERDIALQVLARTTLSARTREREADAIAWQTLTSVLGGAR